MSKIYVIGIGPGGREDMTPAALEAMRQCQVIVGYKYYFQFVSPLLTEGTECIDTGMKRERERAALAFQKAKEGLTVGVVSSGDAGIYGMAPLVYEMSREEGLDISIEVIPGISAFQKAGALLGAPVSHDFCVISLSDLMTPWQLIERRIQAAAMADFVTCVYNPKSHGRYWQLYRLKELFLEHRSPQNVVGYVRQAGREEQTVTVTTLGEFDPEQVDMFTVVLIGNSQTYMNKGKMITPRGYYRSSEDTGEKEQGGVGQEIMKESFRTIARELQHPDIPVGRKWPLLHAIHTTADFEMERLLRVGDDDVARMYQALTEGGVRTIVTDVTMAASGIRKGALQRLGIEVKCYLNDPRTADLAAEKGITRSQAGIRLAVEEHPEALYAFGNAPTALMELCTLIQAGKAHPCGVIAAPVGFVHVCESKHMLKPFAAVPKMIIEGRKGGSNLAATLVNSVLCFPDAEMLQPGRDV
jgi:precorrin-3B C17-methyltransferase